jgi:hypothetical protein
MVYAGFSEIIICVGVSRKLSDRFQLAEIIILLLYTVTKYIFMEDMMEINGLRTYMSSILLL